MPLPTEETTPPLTRMYLAKSSSSFVFITARAALSAQGANARRTQRAAFERRAQSSWRGTEQVVRQHGGEVRRPGDRGPPTARRSRPQCAIHLSQPDLLGD